MASNNKIELLNNYQNINRSYTPQELVHELQNIVNKEEYDDFLLLYFGDEARGCRFASTKKRDGFDTAAIMTLILNLSLKDAINF